MEPRQDHERRLNNIKSLVEVYGSRKKFCDASGTSYVHISQMFAEPGTAGHRGVGYGIARKIESTLGLPPQCLDTNDGVAEFLKSRHAGLLPKLSATNSISLKPEISNTLTQLDMSGLTALQVAALESVVCAMKDGRFSNTDCVALLSKWTLVDGQKN